MRLPRFRFTIRRMMIAVAIVGVGTGVETMRRRRSTFLDRAFDWAKLASIELQMARHREIAARRAEESARSWEQSAAESTGLGMEFEVPGGPPGTADSCDRQAKAAWEEARSNREAAPGEFARSARREALARKYERAARYPWLPVAPDPPEPE